jgi:hypothetical protein
LSAITEYFSCIPICLYFHLLLWTKILKKRLNRKQPYLLFFHIFIFSFLSINEFSVFAIHDSIIIFFLSPSSIYLNISILANGARLTSNNLGREESFKYSDSLPTQRIIFFKLSGVNSYPCFLYILTSVRLSKGIRKES